MRSFCCILFLIFSAFPFQAYSQEISKPVTTYSPQEGYYTEGSVTLFQSRDKIDAVFWNFKEYDTWLLDGLSRDDPEAKKLTCTLNRIIYEEENERFRVYFSFNFWFLRNREYSLPFKIEKHPDSNGLTLSVITGERTGRFIEDLEYSFIFDTQGNNSTLHYTAECRLKGFADRFFSLRLYKKNIEWYIYTFANNFIKRVDL